MKTPVTENTMGPEEFTAALAALNWKQTDFCRKTGVAKQTPSRWVNGQTPIQPWVRAYLGMAQEIQRLHDTYVRPTRTVIFKAVRPLIADRMAGVSQQHREWLNGAIYAKTDSGYWLAWRADEPARLALLPPNHPKNLDCIWLDADDDADTLDAWIRYVEQVYGQHPPGILNQGIETSGAVK
jgi:transcriptional regulator with XRE-family HTH domain